MAKYANDCLNSGDIDLWSNWLMCRAIICPTNKNTEDINQLLTKDLPGKLWVYKSFDKALNAKEAHNFPIEFLNSLQLPSIPPHILELKIGSPIILIRNLVPEHGHVNGARYVVRALGQRVIQAELAMGEHKGEILMIPRILFHPQDKNLPFEFERRQFPVKQCFGITANRVQGQSLTRAGIYLKQDFFAHGQLFTAMSRINNPSGLTIYKPKTADGKDQLFMKNVVYQEIFEDNIATTGNNNFEDCEDYTEMNEDLEIQPSMPPSECPTSHMHEEEPNPVLDEGDDLSHVTSKDFDDDDDDVISGNFDSSK